MAKAVNEGVKLSTGKFEYEYEDASEGGGMMRLKETCEVEGDDEVGVLRKCITSQSRPIHKFCYSKIFARTHRLPDIRPRHMPHRDGHGADFHIS